MAYRNFTFSRVSAVASLSALSAASANALRTRLEGLEGVERVLLDGEREGVWLLLGTEQGREVLAGQVRAALLDEGVDPQSVSVEIAARVAGHDRQRVKFLGVQRIPLPEAHTRVRVSLEWDGAERVGEETGETATALEMRTAAVAAVKAVQGISPEDLHLRLIGVKQIRAFDQEITVVSLLRETNPAQRLVGAVLTTEDPLRTAALAVLNALNRVLGTYLSTTG